MNKKLEKYESELVLGEYDFVYKRVGHSLSTVTYEVLHKEGLSYESMAEEIDPISGVFGFSHTKASDNHAFITINVD